MKVHADNGDRGRVFLDGTEITHVLEANEEERYVVQCVLDEKGRMSVDLLTGKLRTVCRHGTVRIEPLLPS